jgi:PEP-CTERM motif
MIKHILIPVALAATCSLPVQAITFEGAVTQGATVVADYSSTGLISFDIDFANLAGASLEYRIDADDLNMPVSFNAILRNFSGTGFDGYTLQLSKGSFDTVGSVTRQFGGAAQVTTSAGAATVWFSSPEFLDVELGNALGTTPGAIDWKLAGFQAGDRVILSVSAVPEPGAWALMLAGLAGVGFVARRRQA